MIDREQREKGTSVRRRLVVALVCIVIYIPTEIWFNRNKLLNPPDGHYIIVFTILTLFVVALLLFCAISPKWMGSNTNLDDPAQLNKLRLRNGFTFGLFMFTNGILNDYDRSGTPSSAEFLGIFMIHILTSGAAGIFFGWWTGTAFLARHRDRERKDLAEQDRSD